VAHKDHALTTIPITVCLDRDGNQFGQCLHGIRVPIGGRELGKAATRQINAKA
jgi:hypothetical protein